MLFKDKGILKALWAGMFILCGLLGFVPNATGVNKWVLLGFGVLFYLPPGLLLYQCRKSRDRKGLRLIRNLAAISLGATLVLLIVNMLSLLWPQQIGDALHYILAVVSTPMFCCQYWLIGLCGWASLLWCGILFLKDMKK